MALAHADLDGYAAIGPILHRIKDTAFLQYRNRRFVGRTGLRHGDGLHRRDERSRIKAGQQLAVGLECGIKYGKNFHDYASFDAQRFILNRLKAAASPLLYIF